MNVIEFFVAYWDWYLLLSVIFAAGGTIIESNKRHPVSWMILYVFLFLVLWPVAVAIKVLED